MNMTPLEARYHALTHEDSDISLHLPTLRELSLLCDVVVEFGVRSGRSTVALLMGGGLLHSVDIEPCEPTVTQLMADAEGRWTFTQADSATVPIPECDMLFIDTNHCYDHLRAELYNHVGQVRRYIAMHDTYMINDPWNAEGMRKAVKEFLRDHPDWKQIYENVECHGFTVLEHAP